MNMTKMQIKAREIHDGDVMFRGVVANVGPVRTARSGRPLLIVTYTDGTDAVLEADRLMFVEREI